MPIRIGIPAYCERDWLPGTLDSLAAQSDLDFEVWICVNQPKSHLSDPKHQASCHENLETLAWLERERRRFPFAVRVFDAVRPPLAHPEAGVGRARGLLFDHMVAEEPDSICISLDADTLVEPHYIARVRAAFARYANAVGLAVPYRHPLPEDRAHALRLLRYEIYMRYYQLSLWRIGSPYAFLPLGSAMAFRGHAYKKAGGMPVREAGEDFYFLQKLRKTGPIIRWIDTAVYPSARPSVRVPFGTGPLMAEPDLTLQSERFPFYPQRAFDLLEETFACFPELFRGDLRLPIHDFILSRMNGYSAFGKMRRNFTREDQFVRACHDRLDGLRTLQFLRYFQSESNKKTENVTPINQLLKRIGKPEMNLVFSADHIGDLERNRNLLADYEAAFQKRFMAAWHLTRRW